MFTAILLTVFPASAEDPPAPVDEAPTEEAPAGEAPAEATPRIYQARTYHQAVQMPEPVWISPSRDLRMELAFIGTPGLIFDRYGNIASSMDVLGNDVALVVDGVRWEGARLRMTRW